MKFLGITKNKITKDKNDENLSYLEYSEVVLVYCNIFNNYYQQNSRFLYNFLPNNSSGQLFDISPKSFVFLKHLILNFHKLKCGLLIQILNCKSITLKKTILYSVQPRHQIFVKGYGFLSFARNMGKILVKNISKILSSKYSQKFLDHAKQSATDAFKTASNKVIQKVAEATGNLIGNKIADEIRRVSKLSP